MKLRMLLVCLILLAVCSDAFAIGRRRRSYSRHTVTYSPPAEYASCSDQGKCQLEANYMARHGILAHVWGTIGHYEGWGVGNNSNCDTCVPHTNMTLTGDATAVRADGGIVRVRSWR